MCSGRYIDSQKGVKNLSRLLLVSVNQKAPALVEGDTGEHGSGLVSRNDSFNPHIRPPGNRHGILVQFLIHLPESVHVKPPDLGFQGPVRAVPVFQCNLLPVGAVSQLQEISPAHIIKGSAAFPGVDRYLFNLTVRHINIIISRFLGRKGDFSALAVRILLHQHRGYPQQAAQVVLDIGGVSVIQNPVVLDVRRQHKGHRKGKLVFIQPGTAPVSQKFQPFSRRLLLVVEGVPDGEQAVHQGCASGDAVSVGRSLTSQKP